MSPQCRDTILLRTVSALLVAGLALGCGSDDSGQNGATPTPDAGELGTVSDALVEDTGTADTTSTDDGDADLTDVASDAVVDSGRDTAELPDAELQDTQSNDATPVDTGTDTVADTSTPDVSLDTFVPECSVDSDCDGIRKCVGEICRDYCIGDWCGLATSGDVCVDSVCVECGTSADCPGRDQVCNPERFACEAGTVDPTHTKIGIFYFLWHCPASQEIYDLSDLSPNQWGAVGKFHYWDRPAQGYYCLSNDDAVLQTHATQLRDAGLDFVFIDVTNHAYVSGGSDRTQQMIIGPFDRMLAVWSQVPRAPKIVPWVPVPGPTADPDTYTVDALLTRLGNVPDMHFNYLGKPLVLVTENAVHVPNEGRLTQLAQNYTVRKMWGLYSDRGPEWSFLQPCQQSPLDAAPCNQRSATNAGHIEQVSMTVAYQQTYMSVTTTATPKYGGDTFRKQFQTLFDNPQADIATITGWNEWIAQRQPCDQNPSCPCGTYPNGCFVDTWNDEFNRDMEPVDNATGDLYYRLLSSCIGVFRRGEVCDASNAEELCCQ